MREARTYRSLMTRPGLISFEVRHKETDLHIQAPKDLRKEVSNLVVEARLAIENYASGHLHFFSNLEPMEDDPFAPSLIQTMLHAASVANTGPMASVAGAIAELVGKRCMELCKGEEFSVRPEVIVENGGDIFINVEKPIVSSIWAGKSPLSGKLGINLSHKITPAGLCTSSGTVGHSISFGKADAVTVLSRSTALADAAATAIGNMVHNANDIRNALKAMENIPGILGGVIIINDKLGVWGEIELIKI
jgi:ApbE superfamily uncharacterized protein (UPF0280 family)